MNLHQYFQNMVKKAFYCFLVVVTAGFFCQYKVARAANLTQVSDTLTRIHQTTLSSHSISFTLGAATALDAAETVAIDFNEDGGGFTVGGAATVVGDLDFAVTGADKTIVDVDGSCVGHDGANNVVAQVNDATGVLTFTTCTGYTSSAVQATITVEYGTAAGGTNRVTNPATSVPVVNITAAGDTGAFATAIIDNDQFTVSATVDPSITFSLSATATDFGVLSTAVKSSAPNIVLETSTNATNGYNITIHDQGSGVNPGLYNSIAPYLLGSANAAYDNTADLAAVAGYGIQATSVTATIDARYAQAGTNVGGYELTAQNLASYNDVADAQQVTLVSRAKMPGSAPAGSYSDTVTVVATANF